MNDLQRRARRRRIVAWVKRNAPPLEPVDTPTVVDDAVVPDDDADPMTLATDAKARG